MARSMKQVLFFGDSLTAGYGLGSPQTQSLPALLSERAISDGNAFHFINAGISGDTTASALIRLPKLLQLPSDIIVVALGANDMLRGYPADTLATNLENVIQLIKKAHPQSGILLLGMELPKWITAKQADAYRNIYANLAKHQQLSFLPFLLEGVIGDMRLNLPDRVHPNAKGYQLIAHRVWPLLKKLLDTVA